MPYARKADLPEAIQALPDHAAEIWRKAFNASVGEYGEERAFKIAWAAVKNAGYEKGEDGEWHKKATESALVHALRSQTQFAKGELAVLESGDSVTVEHGGKRWTAGCTADGKGGFAFGSWSVTESPQPEPFSAEVRDLVRLTVLESEPGADPREHTVVLIESGDNLAKRRRYTGPALESAVAKYDNMPMYLDHAGTERKPAGVRMVKDLAARVLKPWIHKLESGATQVRAKIHIFDNWLNERLADPHFRELVGLSHDADVVGKRERLNGGIWEVIESIAGVRSVDFVSKAAFGGKVLESDGSGLSQRTEDLMALETLTIADLKAQRADLVTALEAEAQERFRALESESDTVTALKTENATLKAQAKDTAISQAVAEAVAAPDAGVPEAARVKVAAAVTADLRSKNLEGEALKTAALESVKATVEMARSVTGTKPAVKTGDPTKSTEEITPSQKLGYLASKLV